MTNSDLKTYTLPLFLACVFAVSPQVVSAQYTIHGQEFSTFAEMQAYASEYLAVWRELNGTQATVQTTTPTRSTESVVREFRYLGVQTTSADDIEHDGASLIGKVQFKNSKYARIWFDYGTHPLQLSFRTETEDLKNNNRTEFFDRKIRQLAPNTTYYYRAGAINEDGIYVFGGIESFQTPIDHRTDRTHVQVRTSTARGVDDTRATLRATVTFREQDYAYVWFEYGEEEDDLYEGTSKQIVYSTDGRYVERIIRRLDAEQYYYFRAVAEDASGSRSYGKVYKFKTRRDIVNELPKVTTYQAEAVEYYKANIGGEVDMNDYDDGTVFLVYGEDRDAINNVATQYRQYKHIRERGDDRRKVLLDDDLDRDDLFAHRALYLDLDTTYYFALGVEFEYGEDNEVLLMGYTRSFKTYDIR